jgi:hypothetical protein
MSALLILGSETGNEIIHIQVYNSVNIVTS